MKKCDATVYFFVTSLTKLFFSAEEVRNRKISSFCCWVSGMGLPLLREIIKDFEELSFYDISLIGLSNQVMF